MAFIDFVERVQQAPESVRKIILVVIVTIIMAGVIAVLVLQLKYQSSSKESIAPRDTPAGILWSATRANIKKLFEGIKSSTVIYEGK